MRSIAISLTDSAGTRVSMTPMRSASISPAMRWQVTAGAVLGQVHELDRVIDFIGVKKRALMLAAQLFQRRLARHGEKQRGALGRGQCKDHLMRQRGLAATGRPGDQVERTFHQHPAEH